MSDASQPNSPGPNLAGSTDDWRGAYEMVRDAISQHLNPQDGVV